MGLFNDFVKQLQFTPPPANAPVPADHESVSVEEVIYELQERVHSLEMEVAELLSIFEPPGGPAPAVQDFGQQYAPPAYATPPNPAPAAPAMNYAASPAYQAPPQPVMPTLPPPATAAPVYQAPPQPPQPAMPEQVIQLHHSQPHQAQHAAPSQGQPAPTPPPQPPAGA